jgi:hypothetical protein
MFSSFLELHLYKWDDVFVLALGNIFEMGGEYHQTAIS